MGTYWAAPSGPQKQPTTINWRVLGTTVGALALLLVVALVVVVAVDTKPDLAEDRCRAAVLNALHAPSTAVFSSIEVDDVGVIADAGLLIRREDPSFDASTVTAVWRVRGDVDFQNVFGAVLRNEFICRAVWTNDDFYGAFVYSFH